MKENGEIINKMEKEYFIIKVVVDMKVNLVMIMITMKEKDYFILIKILGKVIDMKVTGEMD